ncbi:uncharacterized protein F5147DRAFT_821583 [Suillus discolor]|uniref:Uncharacterized protein n=1 Tax=Suillus discolor TaxID=1912936 RepID=A0A9P7EWP4_9AGAM|nr:uncharacterized protein F5147DRAFT_821583 [Suillus discolor]KAG2092805.1 hypothetical protein F5147DRAFT_821583 [Suillus discolor]
MIPKAGGRLYENWTRLKDRTKLGHQDKDGEMFVQDLRSTGREEASSAFDSELLSLSQSELASPNTVAVPSYTGKDGDHQLAKEVTEDKLRRVRHQLEPGDVIEAVSTVCRVSSADSFLGMLIFGRTHLYMLEGLIETSEGEVIGAGDALEGLIFISGSAVDVWNSQRAQRWSLEQVSGFSDRMFLFQDVGFEIFFKDSCMLLVIFLDKSRRQWSLPPYSQANSQRVLAWVLNYYVLEVLDLSSTDVFRDLAKLMGALTAERREAVDTRYTNLSSVDEEPFHYRTHISSFLKGH